MTRLSSVALVAEGSVLLAHVSLGLLLIAWSFIS